MGSHISDWCLVEPGGEVIPLSKGMVFIGTEDCDVTLKCTSVDKRHAVLNYHAKENRFSIKDLSSLNGTHINDHKIAEQENVILDNNDRIQFGDGSLVYRMELSSEYHPPVSVTMSNALAALGPPPSPPEPPPPTMSETTPTDDTLIEPSEQLNGSIVGEPLDHIMNSFTHTSVPLPHKQESLPPTPPPPLLPIETALPPTLLPVTRHADTMELDSRCLTDTSALPSRLPSVPMNEMDRFADCGVSEDEDFTGDVISSLTPRANYSDMPTSLTPRVGKEYTGNYIHVSNNTYPASTTPASTTPASTAANITTYTSTYPASPREAKNQLPQWAVRSLQQNPEPDRVDTRHTHHLSMAECQGCIAEQEILHTCNGTLDDSGHSSCSTNSVCDHKQQPTPPPTHPHNHPHSHTHTHNSPHLHHSTHHIPQHSNTSHTAHSGTSHLHTTSPQQHIYTPPPPPQPRARTPLTRTPPTHQAPPSRLPPAHPPPPPVNAYNRTVYTHQSPVQSCQVVTGQFVQVQGPDQFVQVKSPDLVYANGVPESILRTSHHNADLHRQTPRQVYLTSPEQGNRYVPVRVVEGAPPPASAQTSGGNPVDPGHRSRSEFVAHNHDRYRPPTTVHNMQPSNCDNQPELDSWSTHDVQHLQHTSPLQETVYFDSQSQAAGMSQPPSNNKNSSDYGCFHVQYQSPHDSYISPVMESYDVASSLGITSKPMTTCIVYTQPQPRSVSVDPTNVHLNEATQSTILYHGEEHTQQVAAPEKEVAPPSDKIVPQNDKLVLSDERIVTEKPPVDPVSLTRQPSSSSLPEKDVSSPSADVPKSMASSTATTPDSPSVNRKDQRRSLTGMESDLETINKCTSLYGQPAWWGEDKRPSPLPESMETNGNVTAHHLTSTVQRPLSLTAGTGVENDVDEIQPNAPNPNPPTTNTTYASIQDEPAEIAVQNSKGSIHTPPEKDTPAPMSFTIDFGEVAHKATASKVKTMSSSKADKAAEKPVEKPVAFTVEVPVVVDKPVAFTVDDTMESQALNNSGNLRDYLPNRMKKGLNSRAQRAKSEKAEAKLEAERSSKTSPLRRRSAGYNSGNSSLVSSDNEDLSESFNSKSRKGSLKSRPESSPKKSSKPSPAKQTTTIHHQISHPTKSPKMARKPITPRADTNQRRSKTPPPSTFKRAISVPEPSPRHSTNETKRSVEAHQRQESANGAGYLFEKMFDREESSDHYETPDEQPDEQPSEYQLYVESKEFDHQASLDADNANGIYAAAPDAVAPGVTDNVLTPRPSHESPAHSKYKPTNQLHVEPLKNFSDNISEAGTYTIESDIGGTEEESARSDIDQVFGVHEAFSTETMVPGSPAPGSPARKITNSPARHLSGSPARPSSARSSPARPGSARGSPARARKFEQPAGVYHTDCEMGSPRTVLQTDVCHSDSQLAMNQDKKSTDKLLSSHKSSTPQLKTNATSPRPRPTRRHRKSHSPEQIRPSSGRKLPSVPARKPAETPPTRGETFVKSPTRHAPGSDKHSFMPAERDADMNSARSIDTDILCGDTADVVRHIHGASRTDNIFLPVRDVDSDSDSSYCANLNGHDGAAYKQHDDGKRYSNGTDSSVQRKPPRPATRNGTTPQPRQNMPGANGVRRCKSTPYHKSGQYNVDLDASSEFGSDISTDYSPAPSPKLGRKSVSKGKSPLTVTKNRAFELRRQRLDSSDTEMSRMQSKSRQAFVNNTKTQSERPKSAGYNKNTDYRSMSEGRDLRPSTASHNPPHRNTRSISMGRDLSKTRPQSSRDSARTDRTDASLGAQIVKKSRENLRHNSSPAATRDQTPHRQHGVPLVRPGKPEGYSSRPPVTERRSLAVSGHKSQPSSRSNSPKTPAYSAWQRRKGYDPRKAAAEDKAQKKHEKKMARARSVGPAEDLIYRRGGSSVSSEDPDSSYMDDEHETSVSEMHGNPISRMSSNVASNLTNMSHSIESDESFQVADLPYDRQTSADHSRGSRSHDPFRALFGNPLTSSTRSAFSVPPRILDNSTTSSRSTTLDTPYTASTRPSRASYKTLSIPDRINRNSLNPIHTRDTKKTSLDPSLCRELREVALQVKSTTNNILEQLSQDHDIHLSPSPVHGYTDSANIDLITVLENLNTTNRHLKAIEKTLIAPAHSHNGVQSQNSNEYLEELNQVRSTRSFAPIDGLPRRKPPTTQLRLSKTSGPLQGSEYY